MIFIPDRAIQKHKAAGTWEESKVRKRVKGGVIYDSGMVPIVQPNIDQSTWPFKIKLVAMARRPEDRGVGDTAKRMIEEIGGGMTQEQFAAEWEKITGKKCTCADHQAHYNLKYPYPPDQATPAG